MLILTRRGVLLGATAMTAAGMMPAMSARAANRVNHALLVACTDYPNLPQRVWLAGPKNDGMLVREFLLGKAPVKFEPENVALLSNDIDGAAGAPTHANILDQLGKIAAKAVHGDFVYLHLSGHGAQQPETTAGSETDGLDEIFLPSDTGKWENRESGVPNALVDNEIGAALDEIRKTGAFVWAIFDCCHSGSATRGFGIGDEFMKERKVTAEDLGIPKEAMVVAESSGSRDIGGENQRMPAFNLTPTGAESIAKGGLVAFYAAQTIETTPEMPLPKGTPDAPSYGLFTYTIFSKIAENPNMTYRQLGNAILQQYSADSRQRPTPLFEGELDARVFGSDPVPAVLQWKLDVKDGSMSIEAGLLHRLSPGTKLAILPSPASELAKTVGYVEIVSAKNLSSKVKPVAYDKKPALSAADLPPNAYVRLAELAVDFKLVVARPPADRFPEQAAKINAILDELAADAKQHFRMTLVESRLEADLRFAVLPEDEARKEVTAGVLPEVLFLLPPSGDVSLDNGKRPPLIALTGTPAHIKEGIASDLTTIFRATALSRLAVASDYQPDQVNVAFSIRRKDKDEMEPLEAAIVPIVSPGDEIHILATNLSTALVDINILYVGSDYSITHMETQRLVPGAKLEEGLLAFTDATFGMERMIAVLTEAPPQSEIEDLKFLEQGGVPRETRSISGPLGFSDMLMDVGLAPSTRSAMKLGDRGGSKGAVMIFPLETVPRVG